jgi:predicted nuclease of predicted toxin-antitoxin system
LATWIAGASHVCEHVADVQMPAAADSIIWKFALERGLAIVTKDEDFARRKSLETGGPAIVWIRWPNTRRRELIARFARVFPALLTALQNEETLVEVA